jgi:hypothetical protein
LDAIEGEKVARKALYGLVSGSRRTDFKRAKMQEKRTKIYIIFVATAALV